MLFMVIEKFNNCDARPVYRRLAERGRSLPEGLVYIDSWIEGNFNRCFQLMECDDISAFQKWIIEWQDLVEFEIIPVLESKKTAENISQFL